MVTIRHVNCHIAHHVFHHIGRHIDGRHFEKTEK